MKRFFASLLGVVVFFLLVPTCTIIIARDFMSEKTIGQVMEIAPQLLDNESVGETMAESFIEKIEEYDPEFARYIDEEKLQEEFVKFVVSMFESFGDPNSEHLFDMTGLKNYLEKTLENYADEKDVTITEAEMNEIFKSLDELNSSRDKWESEIKEIFLIFEAVYSNEILITLISTIVLCLIIMFVLLRDISVTLLKVKTPFMINGIGTLLVGYSLYTLLNEARMNDISLPSDLVSILTTPFYKVAAVSIGISIVLIIIAKVLKNNRSISNSNAALENLGNINYNPNNNLTNTPYNGYQNH